MCIKCAVPALSRFIAEVHFVLVHLHRLYEIRLQKKEAITTYQSYCNTQNSRESCNRRQCKLPSECHLTC